MSTITVKLSAREKAINRLNDAPKHIDDAVCAAFEEADAELSSLRAQLSAAEANIEALRQQLEDAVAARAPLRAEVKALREGLERVRRDYVPTGEQRSIDALLTPAQPREASTEPFEADCDRECTVMTYRAGYSLPVEHSPFCKHRKSAPKTRAVSEATLAKVREALGFVGVEHPAWRDCSCVDCVAYRAAHEALALLDAEAK